MTIAMKMLPILGPGAGTGLVPQPQQEALTAHQVDFSQFAMESKEVLQALRASDPRIAALPDYVRQGQKISACLAQYSLNPLTALGGVYNYQGQQVDTSVTDRDFTSPITYKRQVLIAATIAGFASLAVSSWGGFSETSYGDLLWLSSLLSMAISAFFALTGGYLLLINWDELGRKERIYHCGPVLGLLVSMALTPLVTGFLHALIATPIAALVSPAGFLAGRFLLRKRLEGGLESLRELTGDPDAAAAFFQENPEIMEDYFCRWLPQSFEARRSELTRQYEDLCNRRIELQAQLEELAKQRDSATVRRAREEVSKALECVQEDIALLVSKKLTRVHTFLRDLIPIQDHVRRLVGKWREANRIEQIRLEALQVQEESEAALAPKRAVYPRYRVTEVHEVIERVDQLLSAAGETEEFLAAEEETH